MGPDYDDVGAIAMLHAYADSNYVNILGTIASTRYEGVASVLDAFNTYYNKPNIPVGVPKDALNRRDWQFWTDTVTIKYPHKIKKNNAAYDAIELYRKLLASQPDNSVTILTVGFFSNISNLLKSKPDQYSRLNGKELINNLRCYLQALK
ncbi:Inosine-uridine preferring nucleoside hydrolase [compost metagenome]